MFRLSRVAMVMGVFGVLASTEVASAQPPEDLVIQAELLARNEVPALHSAAKGSFIGRLVQTTEETGLTWELYYPAGLNVTQAHIHFGQEGVNGGIMTFLCSNLGNGPEGTQACPESADDLNPVTGFIAIDDIIGPAAQGIAAGNFFAFQRAVRQSVAYVNVHTVQFPGGLLRGQTVVTAEE